MATLEHCVCMMQQASCLLSEALQVSTLLACSFHTAQHKQSNETHIVMYDTLSYLKLQLRRSALEGNISPFMAQAQVKHRSSVRLQNNTHH